MPGKGPIYLLFCACLLLTYNIQVLQLTAIPLLVAVVGSFLTMLDVQELNPPFSVALIEELESTTANTMKM